MKRIFCLWIIFVGMLSASAQQLTPMSRAALDSLVYPPVMAGADSILKFQRYTAQIDTLSELHPPVSLVYPFCNISSDTVEITHVRTLCGCTETNESARSIPPGAKDSITIRFIPLGKAGKIHQRAYVYTALSTKPVACLEIVGHVIFNE